VQKRFIHVPGECQILVAKWHMKRIKLNDRFRRAWVILELKDQLKMIFCETTLTVRSNPVAKNFVRITMDYCNLGLCNCFELNSLKKKQDKIRLSSQYYTNQDISQNFTDPKHEYQKDRQTDTQNEYQTDRQTDTEYEDDCIFTCFSKLFKKPYLNYKNYLKEKKNKEK